MNDHKGRNRGPGRSRAVALAATVAVLVAACGGSRSQASVSSRAAAPASSSGRPDCLAVSRCYAPRQFRVAYGIQPLLDKVIGGRDQTVVLPKFAQTVPVGRQRVTDIRQDLADFDSRFGLPPARIQVITTLAGSSASPCRLRSPGPLGGRHQTDGEPGHR